MEKQTQKKQSYIRKQSSHLLVQNWWMILFFLACGFFYENISQKTFSEFQELSKQKKKMLEQIEYEQKKHALLIKQKKSEGDPEWERLLVKRVLGMIEEGETKVYFAPPSTPSATSRK